MATPAATPEMLGEEEVEISEELYDLVSTRATELGYTEDEFINDALRTFLLLSADERSEALGEPRN